MLRTIGLEFPLPTRAISLAALSREAKAPGVPGTRLAAEPCQVGAPTLQITKYYSFIVQIPAADKKVGLSVGLRLSLRRLSRGGMAVINVLAQDLIDHGDQCGTKTGMMAEEGKKNEQKNEMRHRHSRQQASRA